MEKVVKKISQKQKNFGSFKKLRLPIFFWIWTLIFCSSLSFAGMPIRLVKNDTSAQDIKVSQQKNQDELMEEIRNAKLPPQIIIIEDHVDEPTGRLKSKKFDFTSRSEKKSKSSREIEHFFHEPKDSVITTDFFMPAEEDDFSNVTVSRENDGQKELRKNKAEIGLKTNSSAESIEKQLAEEKAKFEDRRKEQAEKIVKAEIKPSQRDNANTSKVADKEGIYPAPRIAIVIDDMGINHKRTAQINSLNYPLTASFLTYGTRLKEQIEASQKAGHEIMAHIPMQPKIPLDISADILRVDMEPEEVRSDFIAMLEKFPHIAGVNNHMGSLFTEDKTRMNVVIKELGKRDLFFLDSKTTAHSVAQKLCNDHHVDYVARDVFLDNKDDFEHVLKQLRRTERIARKTGYAIAIGHPKRQTYNALKVWLPRLQKKGIELVPLSQIVQETNQNFPSI